MNPAIGTLLFLATVAAMEGVAYVAHRWVMHGPGWFLYAGHHRVRTGMFEANDLYAGIFGFLWAPRVDALKARLRRPA